MHNVSADGSEISDEWKTESRGRNDRVLEIDAGVAVEKK